ncbi:hypothetical protein DIPPA_21830 [Diplonema papillatum]|nr:hypothetical protein DIPPA_21830 [Diplonema papillatum]
MEALDAGHDAKQVAEGLVKRLKKTTDERARNECLQQISHLAASAQGQRIASAQWVNAGLVEAVSSLLVKPRDALSEVTVHYIVSLLQETIGGHERAMKSFYQLTLGLLRAAAPNLNSLVYCLLLLCASEDHNAKVFMACDPLPTLIQLYRRYLMLAKPDSASSAPTCTSPRSGKKANAARQSSTISSVGPASTSPTARQPIRSSRFHSLRNHIRQASHDDTAGAPPSHRSDGDPAAPAAAAAAQKETAAASFVASALLLTAAACTVSAGNRRSPSRRGSGVRHLQKRGSEASSLGRAVTVSGAGGRKVQIPVLPLEASSQVPTGDRRMRLVRAEGLWPRLSNCRLSTTDMSTVFGDMSSAAGRPSSDSNDSSALSDALRTTSGRIIKHKRMRKSIPKTSSRHGSNSPPSSNVSSPSRDAQLARRTSQSPRAASPAGKRPVPKLAGSLNSRKHPSAVKANTAQYQATLRQLAHKLGQLYVTRDLPALLRKQRSLGVPTSTPSLPPPAPLNPFAASGAGGKRPKLLSGIWSKKPHALPPQAAPGRRGCGSATGCPGLDTKCLCSTPEDWYRAATDGRMAGNSRLGTLRLLVTGLVSLLLERNPQQAAGFVDLALVELDSAFALGATLLDSAKPASSPVAEGCPLGRYGPASEAPTSSSLCRTASWHDEDENDALCKLLEGILDSSAHAFESVALPLRAHADPVLYRWGQLVSSAMSSVSGCVSSRETTSTLTSYMRLLADYLHPFQHTRSLLPALAAEVCVEHVLAILATESHSDSAQGQASAPQSPLTLQVLRFFTILLNCRTRTTRLNKFLWHLLGGASQPAEPGGTSTLQWFIRFSRVALPTQASSQPSPSKGPDGSASVHSSSFNGGPREGNRKPEAVLVVAQFWAAFVDFLNEILTDTHRCSSDESFAGFSEPRDPNSGPATAGGDARTPKSIYTRKKRTEDRFLRSDGTGHAHMGLCAIATAEGGAAGSPRGSPRCSAAAVERILGMLDFLCDPFEGGILTWLVYGGLFANAVVKVAFLRLVLALIRLDSFSPLLRAGIVGSYVRLHYVTFLQLYHHRPMASPDHVELCTLHLQCFVWMVVTGGEAVRKVTAQLGATEVVLEELNLEAYSENKRFRLLEAAAARRSQTQLQLQYPKSPASRAHGVGHRSFGSFLKHVSTTPLAQVPTISPATNNNANNGTANNNNNNAPSQSVHTAPSSEAQPIARGESCDSHLNAAYLASPRHRFARASIMSTTSDEAPSACATMSGKLDADDPAPAPEITHQGSTVTEPGVSHSDRLDISATLKPRDRRIPAIPSLRLNSAPPALWGVMEPPVSDVLEKTPSNCLLDVSLKSFNDDPTLPCVPPLHALASHLGTTMGGVTAVETRDLDVSPSFALHLETAEGKKQHVRTLDTLEVDLCSDDSVSVKNGMAEDPSPNPGVLGRPGSKTLVPPLALRQVASSGPRICDSAERNASGNHSGSATNSDGKERKGRPQHLSLTASALLSPEGLSPASTYSGSPLNAGALSLHFGDRGSALPISRQSSGVQTQALSNSANNMLFKLPDVLCDDAEYPFDVLNDADLFREYEKELRPLYRHPEMHAWLVVLMLSLLVHPKKKGTLDPSFTDSSNTEYFNAVYAHLNHGGNGAVVQLTLQVLRTLRPAHVRGKIEILLSLLTTALYPPTLFRPKSKLGSGAYGNVYLCSVDGNPRLHVAVKQVSATTSNLADVFSEVLIARALSSGCGVSVPVHHYGCDGYFFCLVLAAAPVSLRAWRLGLSAKRDDLARSAAQRGGNCAEVAEGCEVDLAERHFSCLLAIYQRVLHAVSVMHAKGIVHCDLKCDNVLLTWPDSSDVGCVCDDVPSVALCDFGESIFVEEVVKAAQRARGTECNRAPEMLLAQSKRDFDRRRLHTTSPTALDVWGLGCVLYELLTGDYPFAFDGFPEFLQHVACSAAPILTDAHVAKLPNAKGLTEYLSLTLCRDPKQRPSVFDLSKAGEVLVNMSRNKPPTISTPTCDVCGAEVRHPRKPAPAARKRVASPADNQPFDGISYAEVRALLFPSGGSTAGAGSAAAAGGGGGPRGGRRPMQVIPHFFVADSSFSAQDVIDTGARLLVSIGPEKVPAHLAHTRCRVIAVSMPPSDVPTPFKQDLPIASRTRHSGTSLTPLHNPTFPSPRNTFVKHNNVSTPVLSNGFSGIDTAGAACVKTVAKWQATVHTVQKSLAKGQPVAVVGTDDRFALFASFYLVKVFGVEPLKAADSLLATGRLALVVGNPEQFTERAHKVSRVLLAGPGAAAAEPAKSLTAADASAAERDGPRTPSCGPIAHRRPSTSHASPGKDLRDLRALSPHGSVSIQRKRSNLSARDSPFPLRKTMSDSACASPTARPVRKPSITVDSFVTEQPPDTLSPEVHLKRHPSITVELETETSPWPDGCPSPVHLGREPSITVDTPVNAGADSSAFPAGDTLGVGLDGCRPAKLSSSVKAPSTDPSCLTPSGESQSLSRTFGGRRLSASELNGNDGSGAGRRQSLGLDLADLNSIRRSSVPGVCGSPVSSVGGRRSSVPSVVGSPGSYASSRRPSVSSPLGILSRRASAAGVSPLISPLARPSSPTRQHLVRRSFNDTASDRLPSPHRESDRPRSPLARRASGRAHDLSDKSDDDLRSDLTQLIAGAASPSAKPRSRLGGGAANGRGRSPAVASAHAKRAAAAQESSGPGAPPPGGEKWGLRCVCGAAQYEVSLVKPSVSAASQQQQQQQQQKDGGRSPSSTHDSPLKSDRASEVGADEAGSSRKAVDAWWLGVGTAMNNVWAPHASNREFDVVLLTRNGAPKRKEREKAQDKDKHHTANDASDAVGGKANAAGKRSRRVSIACSPPPTSLRQEGENAPQSSICADVLRCCKYMKTNPPNFHPGTTEAETYPLAFDAATPHKEPKAGGGGSSAIFCDRPFPLGSDPLVFACRTCEYVTHVTVGSFVFVNTTLDSACLAKRLCFVQAKQHETVGGGRKPDKPMLISQASATALGIASASANSLESFFFTDGQSRAADGSKAEFINTCCSQPKPLSFDLRPLLLADILACVVPD